MPHELKELLRWCMHHAPPSICQAYQDTTTVPLIYHALHKAFLFKPLDIFCGGGRTPSKQSSKLSYRYLMVLWQVHKDGHLVRRHLHTFLFRFHHGD